MGTDWKATLLFRRLYRNQIAPRIIATTTMTAIAIPALAPPLSPESDEAPELDDVDEADEPVEQE